MKLSKRSKWAILVVAGAGLLVVACKSTFSLETDFTVVGQSGKVRIAYDGRDVKAEELPSQVRADVKFFDAKGGEIAPGATGVGEGQRVVVPQGATHCQVSGASSATACTGCAPGGGGGGGGGMWEGSSAGGELAFGAAGSCPSPVHTKWVYVYTLDPDVDGSTAWGNVSGSFTIQGNPDADGISKRIEAILIGGPGTAVPQDVEVDTFVRMLPEALGARLVVADRTQGFTALSMSWNAQPYTALGGKHTTLVAAPNGWQAIEVFIPMTEFHFSPGGGSSNVLDLDWSTFEDVHTNEMHQAVAYF